MIDQETYSPSNGGGLSLENGTGGKGGSGGHGGHGGGVGGESGLPGEPGFPGSPGQVRSVGIPLATWITVIIATIGGIYWLIGLEAKINEVRRDGISFRDNVMSLNTPLSQRVFSAEARLAEISRIQTEVRASIASMDANGTNPNKLLRREVELVRAELAGLNTRCQEGTRRLDTIQSDVLENKIRIENVIEAITPHDNPRKR